MCQIFAGKSNKIRATLLNTKDLMDDLFNNNADGLGAMYATSKRVLRTPKLVPKTLDEAISFVRQLPDDERNLVLHFRMKTSGSIDNDNAHPFVVLPNQMAMTHNGVLSIDTKDDLTKCDTRHYIEKVLRPQLQVAPGLAYIDQWLDLVGADIQGNNRFVFMNSGGEMSFVNRETGIEHDGMWIANTYSFDASLLIPGYKPKFSYPKGWDKDWDDYGMYGRYNSGQVIRLGRDDDVVGLDPDEEDDLVTADDVWGAHQSGDALVLADYLLDRPLFTLRTLMDDCDWELNKAYVGELNKSDDIVAGLLADGDIKELVRLAMSSDWRADQIAEVLCQGDLYGKPINAKEDSVKAAEAEIQQELREEQTRLALTAGATAANEDYAG